MDTSYYIFEISTSEMKIIHGDQTIPFSDWNQADSFLQYNLNPSLNRKLGIKTDSTTKLEKIDTLLHLLKKNGIVRYGIMTNLDK